jgi:acetyl/propionyl-CoA carboxylase alpha subunit
MVYSECKKIGSLLVANRGEIACRIIRTAKRLGIRTIAVFSEADKGSPHVSLADQAIGIGDSESGASYLNVANIIGACRAAKAEGVHPGYGFLSENSAFAANVSKEGLRFIGPAPEVISLMGDKTKTRELASKCSIPLLPALMPNSKLSAKLARDFAKQHGYPVMIKAAGGGGGRGMRVVDNPEKLEELIESARRESAASFANDNLYLEKFVPAARHVEVQMFGDHHGNIIHLFDRDCTLQRNNQKVIEEAPAPLLDPNLRQALYDNSIKLFKAAGYTNAGTAEFLVTPGGEYYFLEVNARLQVEHPVTEAITGLDLVELQIRIEEGFNLNSLSLPSSPQGHALEVRLCAEEPEYSFRPSTGRIDLLSFERPAKYAPSIFRIDSGYQAGNRVTHFYDSLMAKLITHCSARGEAFSAMLSWLNDAKICGPKTNIGLLRSILHIEDVVTVKHTTRTIDSLISQKSSKNQDVKNAALYLLLSAHQNFLTSGASSPAWRIFGSCELKEWFSINGRSELIELHPEGDCWRLSFNDDQTTFSQISYESGVIKAKLDEDFEVRANLFRHHGWQWISSIFGITKIDVLPPPRKLINSSRNSGEEVILSPLPGKVTEVKVQKGQKISEGTILLVLESMKMEHQIKAQHSGVVLELFIKPLTVVENGAPLLKLAYG